MKRLMIIIFIGFMFFSCEQEPEITYTITYFGNGNTSGSVPLDTNQYKAGHTAIIKTKGNLSKINYNFSHWNTKSDNTGDTFNEGNSVTINSDISLYAIWVETDKYSVSFIDEGELYLETTFVFYGEKITRPENPLKPGYNFIGWFKDENLSVEWNFLNDIVTEDITLYAKWNLITLGTVNINDNWHFEKTEWIQNGDEKIFTQEGKLQYTLYWTDPTYSTFSHIEIITLWDDSVLYTIDKGIEQLVIEYGPYDDISIGNINSGRARTVDIYGNISNETFCPSVPGSFNPGGVIPNPYTINVSELKYENNIITWVNPTEPRFFGLLLVESGNNNFQTRNIFLDKVTSYIPSKDATSITIYSINSIGGGLSSGVSLDYGPPRDVTITSGSYNIGQNRYEINFNYLNDTNIDYINIYINDQFYNDIPSTYISAYLYGVENGDIVTVYTVSKSGIFSNGVSHTVSGTPSIDIEVILNNGNKYVYFDNYGNYISGLESNPELLLFQTPGNWLIPKSAITYDILDPIQGIVIDENGIMNIATNVYLPNNVNYFNVQAVFKGNTYTATLTIRKFMN